MDVGVEGSLFGEECISERCVWRRTRNEYEEEIERRRREKDNSLYGARVDRLARWLPPSPMLLPLLPSSRKATKDKKAMARRDGGQASFVAAWGCDRYHIRCRIKLAAVDV